MQSKWALVNSKVLCHSFRFVFFSSVMKDNQFLFKCCSYLCCAGHFNLFHTNIFVAGYHISVQISNAPCNEILYFTSRYFPSALICRFIDVGFTLGEFRYCEENKDSSRNFFL